MHNFPASFRPQVLLRFFIPLSRFGNFEGHNTKKTFVCIILYLQHHLEFSYLVEAGELKISIDTINGLLQTVLRCIEGLTKRIKTSDEN